jgi:hypothetical protein
MSPLSLMRTGWFPWHTSSIPSLNPLPRPRECQCASHRRERAEFEGDNRCIEGSGSYVERQKPLSFWGIRKIRVSDIVVGVTANFVLYGKVYGNRLLVCMYIVLVGIFIVALGVRKQRRFPKHRPRSGLNSDRIFRSLRLGEQANISFRFLNSRRFPTTR